MTNTLDGPPADVVAALQRSWPHLPWSGARTAHGAFHHVLLLPPTAAIRVRTGSGHENATDRDVTNAGVLAAAGLRTPSPLGRPVSTALWSAAAYELVDGEGFTARSWRQDRHVILGLREAWSDAGDRTPSLAASLPPARSWCGGADWPHLVDRLTSGEGDIQRAARKRMGVMLDLEAQSRPSLVHGDFGPHNILLPAGSEEAVLIDADHAAWADPAIDIAPLLAFYPEPELAADLSRDLLDRASAHRRTLSLQVAVAAGLRGDRRLRDHALGNFARRIRSAAPQW